MVPGSALAALFCFAFIFRILTYILDKALETCVSSARTSSILIEQEFCVEQYI